MGAQEVPALYQLLGVSQTVTPAELQRAFRVRALQVHPDKNPGDAGANEAFQRLSQAYEVLRSPERRKRYDENGDATGGDSVDFESILRDLRGFLRPVTEDDITSFANQYRGSAEERSDLLAFVRSKEGDVSNLLDFIMCSEVGDVSRFLTLIGGMFSSGELPVTLQGTVDRTSASLRKRGAAMDRRSAQESRMAARSRAAAPRKAPAPLADLAAAIRGRQAGRGLSFLEQLEDKYGGGAPVGGAPTAVRKRPATASEGSGPAKRAARSKGQQ